MESIEAVEFVTRRPLVRFEIQGQPIRILRNTKRKYTRRSDDNQISVYNSLVTIEAEQKSPLRFYNRTTGALYSLQTSALGSPGWYGTYPFIGSIMLREDWSFISHNNTSMTLWRFPKSVLMLADTVDNHDDHLTTATTTPNSIIKPTPIADWNFTNPIKEARLLGLREPGNYVIAAFRNKDEITLEQIQLHHRHIAFFSLFFLVFLHILTCIFF